MPTAVRVGMLACGWIGTHTGKNCDDDVDGADFNKFGSCFNKAGHPPRTLGCPQN